MPHQCSKKGVDWKVGKVFCGDELRYQFDLAPQPAYKMPAMINLQQYHLEEYIIAACKAYPHVELRWKHKLLSLRQETDHAVLAIETPDGIFTVEADWVVACDGANSDTRKMVGAEFTGQAFQDRFLIADVVMKADYPAERWFWFDPPFHRNQSALLHKQADDVWRIDFQLGWDADPNEEKKPENVIPRLRAMLGEDREFELEWVSIYQFACRRIDKFRHGRVLFAGDAAHQVSPFGARGANTGIQDIDNLGWKLKLVIEGAAPIDLVDSYHDERAFAADDNIRASTRSTDFITPKSEMSRRFRDAVLDLAGTYAFARPLVNSGTTLDADALRAFPAQYGRRAHLRGRNEAGNELRRCADPIRRSARLAAGSARRSFRRIGLRRSAEGQIRALARRRGEGRRRGPGHRGRRGAHGRALRREAGNRLSDPTRSICRRPLARV